MVVLIGTGNGSAAQAFRLCAFAFGRLDRQGLLDPDLLGRHPAGERQHLDALGAGRIESCAIVGIDVPGERQARAVGALDEVDHDGAMTGFDHIRQLRQMLHAALRDAVGELGEAGAARQMHVLDLDIARGLARRLEQDVDAAVLAVLYLPPERGEARELRHATGFDGLCNQSVGMVGVDPDEGRPAAEISLDELPSVGVLSGRAVGHREPYRASRLGKPQHGTGVGTGGGDRVAVVEADVGEEPLVALDERAAEEGGGELHGGTLGASAPSRKPPAVPLAGP